MPGGPPDEILNAVSKRRDIIDLLLSGVDDRQELVRKVSVSRMTVDRALRELEKLNVVTSVGSDYRVTPFGRHAYQLYEEIVRDYENLDHIRDLLELLPADSRVAPAVLVDAKVIQATMSSPQEPQYHLLSQLETSSTVLLLTPVVDQRITEILHERTVEDEKPTSLLLDEDLAEFLWVEQGKRWKAFVTSTVSSVTQMPNRPPYSLLVADERMLMGFYDDHGSLRGVIDNEAEAAVSWAESRLEAVFAEGREVVIRSSNPDGTTNQIGRFPSSG